MLFGDLVDAVSIVFGLGDGLFAVFVGLDRLRQVAVRIVLIGVADFIEAIRDGRLYDAAVFVGVGVRDFVKIEIDERGTGEEALVIVFELVNRGVDSPLALDGGFADSKGLSASKEHESESGDDCDACDGGDYLR